MSTAKKKIPIEYEHDVMEATEAVRCIEDIQRDLDNAHDLLEVIPEYDEDPGIKEALEYVSNKLDEIHEARRVKRALTIAWYLDNWGSRRDGV